MTEYLGVIEGFRRLLKDCGPAAEPFVRIDLILEQPNYLSEWRRHLEKHIQDTYLPRFAFESNVHFRWHLRERDDQFLLLRGRMPDTYFEHWIRAIMVPRSVHYYAEVALALKCWESKYRGRLEHMGAWNDDWRWTTRVQRVLALAPDLHEGDAKQKSIGIHTIYRWEREAEKLRAFRARRAPRSGWQLKEIALPGDHEAGCGNEHDHGYVAAELDHEPHYRETWIWNPIKNCPTPLCDEITFSSPALSSLWSKPWKSKRKGASPPGRFR